MYGSAKKQISQCAKTDQIGDILAPLKLSSRSRLIFLPLSRCHVHWVNIDDVPPILRHRSEQAIQPILDSDVLAPTESLARVKTCRTGITRYECAKERVRGVGIDRVLVPIDMDLRYVRSVIHSSGFEGRIYTFDLNAQATALRMSS